jgi:DNA polymerase-3 subunit gamma/tau
MTYQVLARKWRPQQFDDVVGQTAVARTLANAIRAGRIAQSFVFAGPRGVGKTTTARILARALSCEKGPTAQPCGVCDPCREIAEGRDIDVLEIDAATHTGIDNIREVIVSGLSIMPVRDRYKVFLIDEVHQLSIQSFNALLKSIEEPPPHVIFMMATTELSKIPETVLSRSQVFEFKTISSRQIADQLRKIADAENITVDQATLALIARDAEGSMRDAQSALDQVIAFAGQTVTVEDASTVLGLVGRDLVLDIAAAVADETPAAAFELAARAIELGHEPRSVVRELARIVRDLLVVSVDRSRIDDPEIAAESERERMTALAQRFSREDLLRAFDMLSKTDVEIRSAPQPRYHLEMALLRWIHLRKLVPLTDLLGGMTGVPSRPMQAPAAPAQPAAAPRTPPAARPAPVAPPVQRRPTPEASTTAAPANAPRLRSEQAATTALSGDVARDAFLLEIRKSKVAFYNTVVAQAQRIDFGSDRVTFSFLPAHRALREQLDQKRPWLEQLASTVAGKRMLVVAEQVNGPAPARLPDESAADPAPSDPPDLKRTAMADSAVQAMLDVFPAEIENVEEIE